MGREYTLGHIFTRIDKRNFKQDLIEVVGMDEDVNGNNGDEYTDEQALAEGFTSTAEWIVYHVITKYGETQKAIEESVQGICDRDPNYYDDYSLEIDECEDYFVISLAYMTTC